MLYYAVVNYFTKKGGHAGHHLCDARNGCISCMIEDRGAARLMVIKNGVTKYLIQGM